MSKEELITQKFLEIAEEVGKQSDLYHQPDEWNISAFIGMLLQSCTKLCYADITPQEFESEMAEVGAIAILAIRWMQELFEIDELPEDVDKPENLN